MYFVKNFNIIYNKIPIIMGGPTLYAPINDKLVKLEKRKLWNQFNNSSLK